MKPSKDDSPVFVWIFQIIAGAILLYAGFLKFNQNPIDIEIFTALGMEPQGRYLIALIEVIAGIFLLYPLTAASGALIGVGVMMGAIIAHSTHLGFFPQGDNGTHIVLLLAVFLSCVVTVFVRRKQLPIIGKSF